MKRSKRFLSLLLVLLLCASLFPLTVFAEEADAMEEAVPGELTAEAVSGETAGEGEAPAGEVPEEATGEVPEEIPEEMPEEELSDAFWEDSAEETDSGVSFLASGDTTVLSYDVTYHQSEMRQMLPALNSFRTGNTWQWSEADHDQKEPISGRSPLRYDYKLEEIAMQRAAELVVYYAHERPNGTDNIALFKEMGYGGHSFGENLQIFNILETDDGRVSISDVLTSWIEEDEPYDKQGHRRTILEKAYNAVGFAYAEYQGCGCFVQEFGDVVSSTPDPGANDAKTRVSAEILNSRIRSVKYADAASIALSVGASTAVPQARLIMETDGWLSDRMDLIVYTDVSWKADNSAVASVAAGKVTGKGNGVTALRASVFGTECLSAIRVGTAVSQLLVQYNANGGTGTPSPQVKNSGSAIKLSTSVPVKENYTFLGWARSMVAEEPDYAPGASFHENKATTLYAVWQYSGGDLNYDNPEYTLMGTNGSFLTTKAENGKAKLIVYFVPADPHCQQLLASLCENSYGQLDIIAADASKSPRDQVAAFMSGYQAFNITSAYAEDYGIIESLSHYALLFDIKGDISVPVCVYIDTNNRVQKLTAGGLGQEELFANIESYCGVKKGGIDLNEYTVTYDANGGEGIPDRQKKMSGGTVILSTVKPLRNGYTFQGWTDSPSSKTVKYRGGDVYSADASITLYAVWKEGIEKLELSNSSYTYTGIDGSSLSTKANGKAKLIVFFAGEAQNCKALFSLLKAGNFTDLDIVAAETHRHSKAEVTEDVGEYASLVSAAWSTGEDIYKSMISYLEKIDRPTAITLPLCVYVDANNKMQQVSTNILSKELLYEYLELCCGVKPTADKTNKEKFVSRMYDVCLGRKAGTDEINYYLWEIDDNGLTGTELAYKFVFDPEFRTKKYCDRHYVIALYKAFMGREPREEEIANWMWRLQKGDRREDVFNEFATSSEFGGICEAAGIVRGDKIEISGKGTKPGGYCTVAGCTAHESIVAFVKRLYNVCLDREPTQDEIDAWHYYLVHGNHTGTTAAKNFVFSNEFISRHYDDTEFVKHLYRAMMGREPDAEGLEYWVWLLGKGTTREDAFAQFAAKDEFKVICKNYGVVHK